MQMNHQMLAVLVLNSRKIYFDTFIFTGVDRDSCSNWHFVTE